MKRITLLLTGAFALGVSGAVFAAEQSTGKEEKEEELEFLTAHLPIDIREQVPKEIKQYIKSFIFSAKDFITATEELAGLADTNKKYRTLVIEALKNKFFKTTEKAQDELFKLSKNGELNSFALEVLKKSGADLNKQGKYGNTALIWAAMNEHTELANMLIKAGADLNIQDEDGATALMEAASNGYKEIVDILIKAGAKLDMQNDYGYTALMRAADYRHKEIVEMLIEAGANLYIQDKDNNTALIWAIRGGREIEQILEKAMDEQPKQEKDKNKN